MHHLVISPPPLRRSDMSIPSKACVLTPPLVVMVTSLLPTSQVILRPPAKRNSAMGDLRGQPEEKSSFFFHNWAKDKQNTDFHQPLGQRREIGEHVSCHHIQTGLSELQVDSLEPLVCLSYSVFVSRAQTAGCGWCVHPIGGQEEITKQHKRRTACKVIKMCTCSCSRYGRCRQNSGKM